MVVFMVSSPLVRAVVGCVEERFAGCPCRILEGLLTPVAVAWKPLVTPRVLPVSVGTL
jgi:hypothetical protein